MVKLSVSDTTMSPILSNIQEQHGKAEGKTEQSDMESQMDDYLIKKDSESSITIESDDDQTSKGTVDNFN